MPARRRNQDKEWMARALALARRGEALASPNPMVGAVLVRNGRVVGEGFHTYGGVKHAEVIALESAGRSARGATLYINLEPCCHTGRTGPCTRALITAGVARVVAAMPDPNPAVAGRGFRQLRAAGIDVQTPTENNREVGYALLGEARRLNEAFSKWIVTRQPYVTLKSALTMDGRLSLPTARGSKARRRWITSVASRAEVQRMRHASDALLTGIGTVLADDPLLTDRTGLPRRRRLLRVLLDSRLRLHPRSKLVRSVRDSDLLVFTRASLSGTRARALRAAGVEVIACAAPASRGGRKKRSRGALAGKIDLQAVLAELGKRNILSVLLESGQTLNDTAISADLVDKVRLFYAPIYAKKLAGAIPPSASAASRSSTWHAGTHSQGKRGRPVLARVRIEAFGPDTAIEGYLHDVYHR